MDELTAGATPSTSSVVSQPTRRERRWLLPAVAAAAAVAIVGVAIAVVGGDRATTPAAPTPTGGPVPTQAPPGTATIAWYRLRDEGWAADATPASIYAGAAAGRQVWVASDYSRVLTTHTERVVDVTSRLADWPTATPLADPPAGGSAWRIGGDAQHEVESGIYWAPDATTAVTIHGYGFDTDELVDVVTALSIEATPEGPRVVSTLSSLTPLGAPSASGLTVQTYTSPDDRRATITAAADHATLALSLYAPAATSIEPAATAFGDGFRMTIQDVSMIWWPVDDGSTWAALSAPADAIDGLMAHVERVGDLPLPTPDASGGVVVATRSADHDADADADAPTTADGCAATHPLATATATDPTCGSVERCGWALTPGDPAGDGPTPATTMVNSDCTSATDAPPTADAADAPDASIDASGPDVTIGEPAMTAAVPPSAPDGWLPPIAVGDSVMLSAVNLLGRAGIEVHATEAAQASGIADELELLRDADRLGDVVVIHAGTNGSMTTADIDRMMAAVTDVERVVVLTLHADRGWIAPNNELIRALPGRYVNVTVVDWNAIAAACGCLTPDGIHVADREVYADAIVSAADLTPPSPG